MGSLEMGKTIRRWVLVYLGAVSFIIVPLYMRYGYFALIGAKARAYLYTAVPALIVLVVVEAADLSAKNDKELIQNSGVKADKEIRRPRTSFFLLAMIGIWALCSSYLSISFNLSLLGTAGWYVGSLMIVVLVICTIYVSGQFQYTTHMVLLVMAVNVFIHTFAIIQSAGIDLFGLLKSIDNTQYYTYLSTIGQKNSYSGYVCLTVPLFWGAFITCRDRLMKNLYGIFAVFGFMGIIMAESDSTYAGIGICILFMLIYVFESEQYVKRSSILLIMYSCCLLAVRYLPVFADKTARFNGFSKEMIKSPVAEIICICSVLLYFLGWRIIRGKRGRIILALLEAALAIIICAYVVYTAKHFSDNWGTKRGMIWRVGWEQFHKFPLRKKITGIGPELLFTIYGEIRDINGWNVTSAHCEPLHVLLTQGIIGLGLYVAYWGYLLTLFIKKKLWKNRTGIFFFPLAAYWGQSLFCSVYPVTAVLFSFVSGMYLKYAEIE